MLNGVIIVYKEKGYTSHDVVAKMRGIFRQKKIGHTGTLDPDAEGVLPVCLGNATKLCSMLEDSTKEYRAVLLLGTTTDTEDAGGTVLSERPVSVSETKVREAILSFQGFYDQIPPMYSAKKVNGHKLVDLARKGITVEREPRRVEIREIEIESVELPRVAFRVVCSRGTYIRTLCKDIGEKLGCGGCMEHLLRTRSGPCRIEEAKRLGDLEKAAEEGSPARFLTPTDAYLRSYEKLSALPEADRFLHNGNPVRTELVRHFPENKPMQPENTYRVYDSAGLFIGLYRLSENSLLRPVTIFSTGRGSS